MRSPLLQSSVWLFPFVLTTGRATDVSYRRDIAPIFADNCMKCHGGVKQAEGLSFVFPETLRSRTESGAIPVVPGDPDKSALLDAVCSDDEDLRMPPKGPRLTGTQIDALRAWIKAGAVVEKHWAYVPPKASPPPAVKNIAWVREPLDRFVLAGLEKRGLLPAPEAAPDVLLRRVTLDLTGLPPTEAERAAFLADQSPEAYGRVVDRLLASPHFGERWAAVWMDLARYADSRGLERDFNRPMWPYRDWLIRAYNADMPFDRFSIRQLAGDLLPNPTTSDLVATAFNRLTLVNDEAGSTDEESRVNAVFDRVETTMTVWMGTTMSCARCHDHPYDPIRQKEYYGLYAFFNETADANRHDDAPTVPFGKLGSAKVDKDFGLAPGTFAARIDQPVALPVMNELAAKDRRPNRVFIRGNRRSPGEIAGEGTPRAFAPFPAGAPRNRLGLAQWLVSRDNPLAARTAVSGFWKQFFGHGLVETREDFGLRGDRPENPALLDTLASRFMNDYAWSVKRLMREIVLSATYRQSTVAPAATRAADPENRLFGRQNRLRLPFEMIRDQALSVSGLLSPEIGGSSVMPVQPKELWNTPNNDQAWKDSEGADAHRRAIYTFWKRSNPYPTSLIFDGPDRTLCTARRETSDNPLQALAMLNDPAMVACAKALADRMRARTSGSPETGIGYGLRLATGREPRPTDIATLTGLLSATGGEKAGDTAWLNVATVILNLDETLHRP